MKGPNLGEFEELVLLAVRRLDREATAGAIQALMQHEARRRSTRRSIERNARVWSSHGWARRRLLRAAGRGGTTR
jgi:hypothetical protein